MSWKIPFIKYQTAGLLLTSTPVVSLLISVVIIISLPEFFNKYEVNLIKREMIAPKEFAYYYDLNKDGESEKFRIFSGFEDYVGIIVEEQSRTVDQWNFFGILIGDKPLFGDISGDFIDEMFIFTYFDGNILLNVISPLTLDTLVTNKFISKYKPIYDDIDCGIELCGFFDLNKDGLNELYFSINSSYSEYPRNFYCYDPANDTLHTSPPSCNVILSSVAFDFDDDGIKEFVGNSKAVANCNQDVPYTDFFSWLMVFDYKMKFKFEPVKVGYYPSYLSVRPFISRGKKQIAVMNIYEGTQNHLSSISLFDQNGQKVKEKEFEYSDEWKFAQFFNYENRFDKLFVIKKNGLIQELDDNLELIPEQKIVPLYECNPIELDIDGDSQNELLFRSKDNESIIITRNDFSEPVFVNINISERITNYSTILSRNEKPRLYVEGDNYSYIFSYYSNPLYHLKYLIYAGIYFCAFIFVLIIQKTQKHRAEVKYETEKKITELQLKSIKNQIDPHFTLNLINSIGSLFYKQDIEKANYIFGKYSKLLRTTILSSDKILIPLSSELDYVENYLELEKFRHNYKFDYNIEVDDAVDREIKIPKMLIHTFVENAVKHGIKYLEDKGEIQIKIENNKADYIIRVNDNGIGRERAKELSVYSTGKGLIILEQILDLYHSLMKIRITYEIKDILDDTNKPRGTEVCIKIPIKG